MDMQKALEEMQKMLNDYEERKKTDPDAVFDVSKLPVSLEVMAAFVKAHEEVKKKMAEAGKKSEE